nr:DUF2851 family protein [Allomuricauda sp.]
MREDLLHFIWQYDKLARTPLVTSQNEKIHVIHKGIWNKGEGPDFFNSKIEIDGQLWAGNVEMHLKASDWYAHHHESDSNYDNVILHVVWEDDVSVFRKDKSKIPTLELKGRIPSNLLQGYQRLLDGSKSKFINCENNLKDVKSILWKSWQEGLYFERLEQKSQLILKLLEESKNDWEAVLFILLCKSFGSKVNGDFFLQRAKQLNFSVVRKVAIDRIELESLFFGHFGLLELDYVTQPYFIQLKKSYRYLKQKFGLDSPTTTPAFFGLRPSNFPTIRLSQLAGIYHAGQSLFQTLMEANTLTEFYNIFQVETSSYWQDHYTFGTNSKKSRKRLTKTFINLILINIVVPLKFCYGKHMGKDWNEDLVELLTHIKEETNSVTTGFNRFGKNAKDAMESQAQLQLHQQYCTKNRCLKCAVGVHLLNGNI